MVLARDVTAWLLADHPLVLADWNALLLVCGRLCFFALEYKKPESGRRGKFNRLVGANRALPHFGEICWLNYRGSRQLIFPLFVFNPKNTAHRLQNNTLSDWLIEFVTFVTLLK